MVCFVCVVAGRFGALGWFAGDLGGFWVVRLPAGFVVILVVVVGFVCVFAWFV